MTAHDRIQLAQRYINSAIRHLSANPARIERANEAIAGARGMLAQVQADDYAEAVRDGRVAQIERTDLLRRLDSDEDKFSVERDVRAHDSAAGSVLP